MDSHRIPTGFPQGHMENKIRSENLYNSLARVCLLESLVIGCIRVIATEKFSKISAVFPRTHGHGEEAQLSSGGISAPTFSRGILFACFRSQTAIERSQTVTESERCFFKSCFSVALLNSLAD